MGKRQTLEEMAESLYDDPEIAAAVVKDADRLKTRDDIEAGRKVLPHPIDAQTWFDRINGREPQTAREQDQASQINALSARLAALESTRPIEGGD